MESPMRPGLPGLANRRIILPGREGRSNIPHNPTKTRRPSYNLAKNQPNKPGSCLTPTINKNTAARHRSCQKPNQPRLAGPKFPRREKMRDQTTRAAHRVPKLQTYQPKSTTHRAAHHQTTHQQTTHQQPGMPYNPTTRSVSPPEAANPPNHKRLCIDPLDID